MSKRRRQKGEEHFHGHVQRPPKQKVHSYEKRAARKTKRLYQQFVEKFGQWMPGMMGER